MFIYHFLQLCPRGHIKVEENEKRTCLKKNFTQTHLNKAGNRFENSKGAY